MAAPASNRWPVLVLLVASLVLAGCTTDEPASAPDGDGAAGLGADTDGNADAAMDSDSDADMEGDGNAVMDGDMEGEPEVAPVPPSAYGPPIPEKGYHLEHLGEGLYWVTDGAYQIMFLTTGEGVIVVDAPPNLGERILAAIGEVTNETITHVIYTHSHADHIASASMYPENVTIIAHEATAEALAGDHTGEPEFPFGTFVGGSPVPAPTVTFADNYTLTVGNQTLELHDLGPAHEEGNVFVYAPAQKVLLVIDVFFPGWVPFLHLALAEDVPAFIAAHDQALSFDFETLVAGHLGRLGTREDVEVQQEYVMDVRANAATALQTVDFNAIAAEVGFANAWLLFGTYLDAVAEECNALTVPDWVDRLGGADLFTQSHCSTMLESLRID